MNCVQVCACVCTHVWCVSTCVSGCGCEVYTIYLLTLIFVPGKDVSGEYRSCAIRNLSIYHRQLKLNLLVV